MKYLKKIGKIVSLTLYCLVGLLITIAGSNLILTKMERSKHLPPGTMVDVNGGKMHIYSEGKGKKKVILWSGLATPAPAIDFKPLIKELKKEFTVIVVENFGYGWSDQTETKRTAENIVAETRLALKKAGFKPPYILLPHSISGLYAMHYTNHYPSEVEAVLGLEVGPAKTYEYVDPIPPSYSIDYLRKLGLVRFITKLAPALAQLPGNENGAYTMLEIELMRLMACWNIWNGTVLNESEMEGPNSKQLVHLKFPETIPTTLLVSKQVTDFIAQDNWKVDWITLQKSQLSEKSDKSRVIVMEGGHYIHWNNSGQIRKILKDMLN